MQIRPKAIEYHCKCITKAENPLRLADDGFGPPRHTIDHMLKKKIICIMLKIMIFSAVARSLLVKITINRHTDKKTRKWTQIQGIQINRHINGHTDEWTLINRHADKKTC